MTPGQRFSLGAQIEEVDRELGQRRSVYPRLVAKRGLRQSVADYQVARLEAVKATLEWLLANEGPVRDFVAAKNSAKSASAGE